MGFGFVEYRKPESAQRALRQLQVSLSCPPAVLCRDLLQPGTAKCTWGCQGSGVHWAGGGASEMGQGLEGRGFVKDRLVKFVS